MERSRESKLHTTSSLIIFRPGQLVCINRWVCVLGNVQLIAFDNDYSDGMIKLVTCVELQPI